jgi:trimeric autotransporter adhesin
MKKIVIVFLLSMSMGIFYAQSPTMIKDINTGTVDAMSDLYGIEYNGKLIFVATTTAQGAELWITDGTPGGTSMIKDISPGPSDGVQSPSFIIYNNKVFFSACTPSTGCELWYTNGTSSGTQMVKDVYPGTGNGVFGPLSLTVANNKLFFLGKDAVAGYELWVSDGTTNGTFMLQDIYPGINAGFGGGGVYKVGNIILFTGYDSNGSELWRSDGTSAGTYMVKDIETGSGNGVQLSNSCVFNGELYFKGTTAAEGPELWKSNGTAAGTMLLKDINSGPGAGLPMASGWYRSTSFLNKIYFLANDPSYGTEVYTTDGTTNGTNLFKDINVGSNGCQVFETFFADNGSGKMFFAANDQVNNMKIFITDGTVGGTSNVSPGNGPSLASIQPYLTLGGILYGVFTEATAGDELWRSDGTSAGTYLIKDIYPGWLGSSITNFTVIGSKMYFSAKDLNTGKEPWSSDGTNSGTNIMADVHTTGSSDPSGFMKAGNFIYFCAKSGAAGRELYAVADVSGIQKQNKDNSDFVVYPNPSKNIFNVKGINEAEIFVYNLLGEELLSSIVENNETQIDLGSYRSGIYILRVGPAVKKIIKE